MRLFGVLELLHGENGRALVGLDLLGIAHHEEDGNRGRDDPEDRAEADDDGLVDLNAHTAQRVHRGTDGERIHRGAKAAAASAQKDRRGAHERIEAGSHHGGGKQRVERNGLLAHTIGGTTEREDDHENGDDGELVALELLNEHSDAVIEGAGLGHHTEEAAQDHHEEAHRQSISEALDGSGEEVAQLGRRYLVGGKSRHDNGDDRHDGEQEKKNGEGR